MSKIMTCLWFDRDGEEAARLYTSLVPNSRIDRIQKAPADYPGGKAGDVLVVEFTLDGTKFMALNGGRKMTYDNAASIVISCDDQAEVDRLWDALIKDGGQAQQCGWLNDRWGVPWQITPRRLMELMASPDPAIAKRVMEAMMEMVKIDIAALEAAARSVA